LKFKGSTGVWEVGEKTEGSTARFALTPGISFQFFSGLEEIQSALPDASIVWDPPDLNPTAGTADQDTTPTQGLPGS